MSSSKTGFPSSTVLEALPNLLSTLSLSLTQMLGRRRSESGDGEQRAGCTDRHCPKRQQGNLVVHPCLRCLVGQRAGEGWREKKKKEYRNKTTTKCFTNPAVNESGSLQHFFYALLIPQGDKHNAEPAPGATSPTRLHCKHCRLPHFMSVNPFKPTGKSASQSGHGAVGRHQEPSVGHTGGPSLSG